MANACKNKTYFDVITKFQTQKVVFVIDECHCSQFGVMHKVIQSKFPHAQYFGFTGTPRFKENPSADGRTSADIFEKLKHTYLIKDAIREGNVLGFNIDYVKIISNTIDETDETQVEAIDTDEVIMAPARIEKISEDVFWNVENIKPETATIMPLWLLKAFRC